MPTPAIQPFAAYVQQGDAAGKTRPGHQVVGKSGDVLGFGHDRRVASLMLGRLYVPRLIGAALPTNGSYVILAIANLSLRVGNALKFDGLLNLTAPSGITGQVSVRLTLARALGNYVATIGHVFQGVRSVSIHARGRGNGG